MRFLAKMALLLLLFQGVVNSCHSSLWSEIDTLKEKVNSLEKIIQAKEANLSVRSVKQSGDDYIITFSDGSSVTVFHKEENNNDNLFIEKVVLDNLSATFTLSDGTTIVFPLYNTLALSFNESEYIVKPESTIEIPFSWTSSLEPVTIEAVSSGDIQVKVVIKSGNTGSLHVRFSQVINEYSKVVVFASNTEKTVMSVLTFEQATIHITSPNQASFPAAGGSFDVSFFTNLGYDVVIPEKDQEWVSYSETKTMIEHSGTLSVKPNESSESRYSTLSITNSNYNIVAQITIFQDEKGTIIVPASAINIPRNGGTVTVPIQSTSSFTSEVIKGSNWLTIAQTKTLSEHSLTLVAGQNTSENYRSAVIQLKSAEYIKELEINQFGVSRTIVIEHESTEFSLPDVYGNSGISSIDWGDESVPESYKWDLTHEYSISKDYEVTITLSKYSGVVFNNIKGIHKLDFSQI